MDNLGIALANVLPLFLLIMTGFGARRAGFVSEEFGATANRFVFTFSLPVLVFESLYKADFATAFLPVVVMLALGGTLVAVPLLLAFSRAFVTGDASKGAFVQGACRGNYVIIGLPIIANLYGPRGAAAGSVLVAFALPMYNILSIILLSRYSGAGRKPGIPELARSVMRNPLVLAVVVALPFSIFGIRLPSGIAKFLSYLSALAVPLALLDIGSGLTRKRNPKDRLAAFAASAWKTLVMPLALTSAGWACGLRGMELGLLYCFGATPTAVASYTMARNFRSDPDLAGDIVIYSTMLSMPALLVGIWILRSLGS